MDNRSALAAVQRKARFTVLGASLLVDIGAQNHRETWR
jgi:hypothetical protein